MRTHRIPLREHAVDVLLAVAEMQPATVSLIAVTTRRAAGGRVVSTLKLLIRRGLLMRHKAVQPPLTREEQLGIVPGRLRAGRRPYLYELTPKGEAVAEGLALAARAFAGRPARRRANGAELRT